MKRGFILGKFMPPHAGHVTLIQSARALVDELSVLVCSQPADPIAGELRFGWMQELFPDCRILWHSEQAPQQPSETPDFWPRWKAIVAFHHPEPIDYLFAGETYGAELAKEVGGQFIPLGGRVLNADGHAIGGLSASAIREAPWCYWDYLPRPVRSHYALTVCLHGIESVGKSTLAELLARHYQTTLVIEYGRSHCETHGTSCSVDDLLLIGRAQQAMICGSFECWVQPTA